MSQVLISSEVSSKLLSDSGIRGKFAGSAGVQLSYCHFLKPTTSLTHR